VLNADDFGFSADTVAATIACFEAGHLSSATIMAGMPATAAAVEFASAHSEFSFGAHLVFVGDGEERPLSAPDLVPHLVDEAGRLLPTRTVRLRALRGSIPVREIELEAAAQLEHLRGLGVRLSHVDSHRHLHKFAVFRRALGRALHDFGIDRVRNAQDIYLRRPSRSPTVWVGPIWRRALMRTFVTTEHFYMPTSAGDHEWHRLAARLPAGASLEVGVHPGYADAWRDAERSSLRPFVEAVTGGGHSLVRWDEIGCG
jgi:predicted glycoside hydrolase/deacetylase ChbG (UPF0249 family)